MNKFLNICICVLFFLFILTSCSFGPQSEKDIKVLRIGVTESPHGEILDNVRQIFNLDFEIVNYLDYETLNNDLVLGKIQANFFQTRDYLESFNAKSDVKLVEIAMVHIEPLVMYSSKYKSIENVEEGDVIYIPSDNVNRKRALELIEDAGFVKVLMDSDERGYTMVENHKNLVINEVSTNLLPNFYQDADFVVMNTNVALQSHIFPHISGVFYEKSFLEDEGKVNVFCTTESMRTSVELKKIAQALNSYETFKYINERYKGFVKSVF